MIEILFLLSFVFLIYAFFYKQYVNEYSINQIDFLSLYKLQELLSEKYLIIVKNVPIPACVTSNNLLKTQRFSSLLGNYLEKKDKQIHVPNELQTYLANETGFQVYGEHTWKEKLYWNQMSEYIITFKSKLLFGNKNLTVSRASYTLIIPIEGTYICSLINPEYQKSLPTYWKDINTIDSLITINKQIQYIDVILRPGSVLIIPTHWYYLMNETKEYGYFGIHEYHEPISLLNEYLEKN